MMASVTSSSEFDKNMLNSKTHSGIPNVTSEHPNSPAFRHLNLGPTGKTFDKKYI